MNFIKEIFDLPLLTLSENFFIIDVGQIVSRILMIPDFNSINSVKEKSFKDFINWFPGNFFVLNSLRFR